jgi:hypothetical protein
MRFAIVLVIIASLPGFASAQTATEPQNSCSQAEALQGEMIKAAGFGEDRADNIIKFYTGLFGTPQSVNKRKFAVELGWNGEGNFGGRVEPLQRRIVVFTNKEVPQLLCVIAEPL